MSELQNKSKIEVASMLAKLFSIELRIKLFGATIIEYEFPPKQQENELP